MLLKSLGQIIFFGLLIELGVKSEIDGKLGHNILFEGLIRHSFGAVGHNGCRIHHHVADINLNLVSGKGIAAPAVDGLPLIVHDIVILEESLTHAEMVLFYLLLSSLNSIGKHSGNKSFVVLHSKAVHNSCDSL